MFENMRSSCMHLYPISDQCINDFTCCWLAFLKKSDTENEVLNRLSLTFHKFRHRAEAFTWCDCSEAQAELEPMQKSHVWCWNELGTCRMQVSSVQLHRYYFDEESGCFRHPLPLLFLEFCNVGSSHTFAIFCTKNFTADSMDGFPIPKSIGLARGSEHDTLATCSSALFEAIQRGIS